MNKDIEFYVRLPYRMELTFDPDDNGYVLRIPDLKGCVVFGETVEEALAAIEPVKRSWLELALEKGWTIPEPQADATASYSGKFNVRLPRYLHQELAELARSQATSLNQLVVALLSEGAGRLAGAAHEPADPTERRPASVSLPA